MSELFNALGELLWLLLSLIGRPIGIIARIFQAVFGRRINQGTESDSCGAIANPIQVFAFSLITAVVSSAIVSAACYFVWQTMFAANLGGGISLFLGITGAIKAAFD
ncbi:MAG: hypothetical protein AAF456_13850 [Planctomycetota bacterium]